MKKCLLSFVILLVTVAPLWASHIVGGEFELRHLEGYQYELTLIQYFDQVNGLAGAEDTFTDAVIYRKSDNTQMRIVRLNNVGSTYVPYTNPACSDERLQTRRILYKNTITLPPEEFNDPEGYYVVYERCCRNYVIDNLEFDGTGQAFYLEFPPVTKDGQPFINTTPILFPPLSDYASVNQYFYFDFSGTDLDGDSLAYSMVVPLNSSETNPTNAVNSNPVPFPKPGPHGEVVFVDGIGVDNMVPGSPDLQIDQKGILRVRPSEIGLFAFAIKVEEFRDGEKIGEVRRDFQMLVIDNDPGTAPVVQSRVKGSNTFIQDETLQIGIDDEHCLEVLITDADPDEQIAIRAEGVNFPDEINGLLSDTLGLLSGTNDTLKFEFCLPECPYIDGPMIIDLIVGDDACSVPLTDTLRLTVNLEGPKNDDPFIVNNPQTLDVEVEVGETFTLDVQGLDDDDDQLILEALGDGFDLSNYGMELQEVLLVPGEVRKTFVWTADCERYDFSRQSEFEVDIQLSDDSDCSLGAPDILRLRLKINLPSNNQPSVFTEGLEDSVIDVRIEDLLSFNVIAEDIDQELVSLTAVSNGFNLSDIGINFQDNAGLQRTSSPFRWEPTCDNVDLNQRSRFDITFIATGETVCGQPQIDSTRVTINVLPPPNQAPEVFLRDVSDSTLQGTIEAPIAFTVVGRDEDSDDILTLRLAQALVNGNEVSLDATTFSFTNVRGRGTVASRFFWIPDCSFLPEDFEDATFDLFFVVEDDACFANERDTVQVTLEIDVPSLNFGDFTPDNAFTPNRDGWGDFFFLNFCDSPANDCDLPVGNCANAFEKIDIFNRWGKLVYTSDNLNFQWYADGMSGGAYYYLAYYSRETYKGRVYVHVPGGTE